MSKVDLEVIFKDKIAATGQLDGWKEDEAYRKQKGVSDEWLFMFIVLKFIILSLKQESIQWSRCANRRTQER